MLYDVLPPLAFFASLGGIILVVSRVVMRVRRQDVSAAIQSEGATSQPAEAHQILNPERKSVRMFGSRVGAMGSAVKDSGAYLLSMPTRLKERRAERKALKAEQASLPPVEQAPPSAPNEPVPPTVGGIQAPTSTWRERLAATFQKASGGVQGLGGKVKSRLSRQQTEEEYIESSEAVTEQPVPKPIISLRRLEERPVPNSKAQPKVVPEEMSQNDIATKRGFFGTVRKSEKPQTPLLQAEEAIKSAQYQKAEEVLVPYIVEHARDIKAYMLLGKVALARHHWDEAMEIFQQVVKMKPEEPGAYAGLGYASLKQGHMTRALEALQRARDIHPKNTKVLKNLLFIARRMDNKVLQRSTLEELIAIDPENSEYKEYLAHLESKEKTKQAV